MTAGKWLVDLTDFHEKFGLEYNGKPRGLPIDLFEFRHKFAEEELGEWYDSGMALAIELQKDPSEQDQLLIRSLLELNLDAVIDILYIVLGTAYLQGYFPILEEAWRRVQVANMSKIRKIRSDGTEKDSGRAPAYDVVKPADFIPPSHLDLVADNAHISSGD